MIACFSGVDIVAREVGDYLVGRSACGQIAESGSHYSLQDWLSVDKHVHCPPGVDRVSLIPSILSSVLILTYSGVARIV